jgi:molybdate transport system substrate-binding protein
LQVFAASSLTEAFTTIGKVFERSHPGCRVTFNFGGTRLLRTQVEQGAVCDVFASADQKHLEMLQKQGLAEAPRLFAHNRLCVILPRANPGHIQTLADLARKGVRLIIVQEGVPVGDYTVQALDKMTDSGQYGRYFTPEVIANAVSKEQNVKQVVAKVALGEADAGFVYVSDVIPSVAQDLRVLEIPERFNVRADYPVAVMKQAPHREVARQFVQFLLSDKGQALLSEYRFIPIQ